MGGGDTAGMIGQTEVVVGAQVEHRAAIGEADVRRLRRGDDPLGLEQSLADKRGRPCREIVEQWSAGIERRGTSSLYESSAGDVR